MKIKLGLVLVAALNAGVIGAYSIQTAQKEVVHSFPNGQEKNSLLFSHPDREAPPYGPTALVVLEDGRIIISEGLAYQTKMFSNSFGFLDMIQPFSSAALFTNGKVLFGAWGPQEYSCSIGATSFGKVYDIEMAEPMGVLLFDSTYAFGPQFNNQIFQIEKGIPLPVTEAEWLKHSRLRRTAPDALTSPDVGLITNDAASLFTHTKYYDLRTSHQPPSEDGTNDTVDFSIGGIFGIDLHGNKYFAAGRRFIVCNKDGPIIVDLKYDDDTAPDTWFSRSCITQNGDIYYLESGKTGHKLIRIKNTWDPITMATLNDSQVRVRDSSSTSGKVLGTLAKGDRVAILETSKDKQTIGSVTAPWYRIRREDWSTGWIFGAFVDVDVVK